MLKTSVQMRRSLFLVLGAFTTSALFAAGFEKNVLWSGKYQGFGGAATSSVNDSEALFFNPAGLGFVEGKGDVHLNFSPTFSEFSGPVSATQPDKKSEKGFSPIGGLTSAYKLNNKFVLGAGVFASGGTNTEYKNIVVGAAPLTDAKAKSELSILDFTLGSAVNITDTFSIGAAWRATYATGELISNTALGGVLGAEVTYKDLKAWDFSSFRLGAQHRGEKLGVGLNVRTAVPVELKGKAVLRTATPSTTSFDDATVAATFPFQIALGADYKITNRFTLFGDASWTNYAANKRLEINVPASPALSARDVELKWHDQWVGRLGGQYQASEFLALRAGYVYTSKVTSDEYARATFSAPGIGHTFSVGSGFDFGALDANIAVDYSIVRGDGKNVAEGLSGDFTTDSITAHLGVAYNY